MFIVGMIRKPVLCILSGALAAVTLYTAPVPAMNRAHAANQVAGMQANAVVPVPVPVSKGVQQLVRLLPELSSRYVVYGGDVDGPGVSGVRVTFAVSEAEKETSADRAIFDAATGALLMLDLQPKEVQKPAVLSDQQAKAKAAAFVSGLQAGKSDYRPGAITREQSLTTVRLVRTVNNVVLDDAYDAFVTIDGAGRIIAFRTFDGRLYEQISLTALPSPERVISAQQAVSAYQASQPLELVYLLPSQYHLADPVQARLAYVIKDGIIRKSHTGSALDALSGKRLSDPSGTQKQAVQTISVNGTGEKWMAQSETQARDLVRKLVGVEPGKLPLAAFTETYDNGQERRFFIWGHFDEGMANRDKPYSMGQFPAGVNAQEHLHMLLETDAKTGQLLRFVMNDGAEGNAKADKSRDWKTAEAMLKRLLPSGTTQILSRDVGDEGLTRITADPLVNGIPVYQEGMIGEQGMYTIQLDAASGKVRELFVNRPAEMIAPARTNALTEQAAVEQLLKAYPLELTYVHEADPQTGEITWKLAYDISFRQTKSHCFCGPEEKVDLTVHVDAVTGQVLTKE